MSIPVAGHSQPPFISVGSTEPHEQLLGRVLLEQHVVRHRKQREATYAKERLAAQQTNLKLQQASGQISQEKAQQLAEAERYKQELAQQAAAERLKQEQLRQAAERLQMVSMLDTAHAVHQWADFVCSGLPKPSDEDIRRIIFRPVFYGNVATNNEASVYQQLYEPWTVARSATLEETGSGVAIPNYFGVLAKRAQTAIKTRALSKLLGKAASSAVAGGAPQDPKKQKPVCEECRKRGRTECLRQKFKLGSITGFQLDSCDTDYRCTDWTFEEILEEAFKRTGTSRSEFRVTDWAKDANGKSHPVEWRAGNGARVNIHNGHTFKGPDVPHIGYQTGGNNAMRGHLLLSGDVPYYQF